MTQVQLPLTTTDPNKENTTMNKQEICTLAHQIRKNTGCDLKEAFRQAYAQANGIAPKTSFNRADLDKVFSDKVSELLSKGYMISTSTMAGTEGEIAKLHFKKDGKLFILLMDKTLKGVLDNKYAWKIRICFGEYTGDLRYGTIWNEQADYTWEQLFVQISEDYFVSEEEGIRINEKAYLRMRQHNDVTIKEVNPAAAEILLKYAHKQQGCKTAKLSDIEHIRRTQKGWSFQCRGKRMSLCFK